MINAYGYCRFSSDRQTEASIEAQKNAIKVYAKEKDYNIIEWYCDRAISGKTADHRPAFMQMFEDITKGEVTAVLIHKLDRFSRSQADYAIYSRKLQMADIELVSVMERLDDSPSGKLLQAVISSINEFYVNNLAHEVMKGLKLNASKAIFNGGIPPLGYQVIDKHFELEPEEAQAVNLIFQLYDQGYHYGQIQHQLNALGYKTKFGKPFGKNSLFDVLRRECYTGVYVYNKLQKRRPDGSRTGRPKPDSEVIRVPDAIPAIVDMDVWKRVQARMDANRDKGGRQKAKECYLLSGLVFCGLCGHRYEGNSRYPAKDRQKYVSYCCSYRHHALNLACDNREVKREVIEGYVLDLLQQNVLNEAVIPMLTGELNAYISKSPAYAQIDEDKCKKRLDELVSSKNNIVDAIARTGFSELFNQKLQELEAEISTVTNTLGKIKCVHQPPEITENMVRVYFAKFRSCIEQHDIPQIKRFIQSYVDRVDVYPDNIKVTFKVAFTVQEGFPADTEYQFERETTRNLLKLA